VFSLQHVAKTSKAGGLNGIIDRREIIKKMGGGWGGPATALIGVQSDQFVNSCSEP
jgi:hypothetical protein